jgi:hypothetical protein
MPPVKGGTIQRRIAGAGDHSDCVTGFVMEANGPGTQDLSVATAGHCSQFDGNHNDVFDNTNMVVVKGRP